MLLTDFDEFFIILTLLLIIFLFRNVKKPDKIIPKSVNYHFTRQCNYECGFCFHTAKTSFVLDLEVAKKGLAMLKEAGKLRFSLFATIK